MAFLRRFWQRDGGDQLAACTALDVGTEFAKALVFEIDGQNHGTVRGVGRKRQGLAHMQSGTVADIGAVVTTARWPSRRRGDGRLPPPAGRHRHAGELVKGFTTAHSQDAQAGRAHHRRRAAEADRRRPARGLEERSARSPGRRASPTSTSACPRGGDLGQHRRLRVTNPSASRAATSRSGSSTPSPRWCTWGAGERRRRARPRAPRDRGRPYAVARVMGPSRSARPAPSSSTSAAGPPTSPWSLRRHRGHPHVRPRGRAFTKSLADRLDLPFRGRRRSRWTTLAAWTSSAATRSPASSPTTWRSGRPGWSGPRRAGRRRPAAVADLPVRRWVAPPRDGRRPAAESFCAAAFSRPPEVTSWPRDGRDDGGCHEAAVAQQDVTPLGLANQAIALQAEHDPLDLALRRVLRAMKL